MPAPRVVERRHGPVLVYASGRDPALPGLEHLRQHHGGRLLRHRIWRRAAALAAAAHALHELPAATALAPFTAADEARRIGRRTRLAARLWPSHGNRLLDAAERTAERLRGLASVEPALVHRDLHSSNVLVDDRGRVTLIDFDGLVAADPALDLGGVAAGLIRDAALGGSVRRAGVETARQFADAYGAGEDMLRRPTPTAPRS